MGSLVSVCVQVRVGWWPARSWQANLCCEANLENSVLPSLQAEEIVGGKYSKSWKESADPELPGGKRDLYLAGCLCKYNKEVF